MQVAARTRKVRHRRRPSGRRNADSTTVIVTVPVAALGRVSKQVARSSNGTRVVRRRTAVEAMLEELGTVATQSMQLWVNGSTRDLGWKHGQVSFLGVRPPLRHVGGLIASHPSKSVVRCRSQGRALSLTLHAARAPRTGRAQVRGALFLQRAARTPDSGELRRSEARPTRSRPHALRSPLCATPFARTQEYFLDEWIFHLWPDAVYRYPTAFKWDGARRPDEPEGRQSPEGPARGGERRPVGTVHVEPAGHDAIPARRRTDGCRACTSPATGRTAGLNIGCVEAAVMSGRLASSGIRGYPDKRLIPGYLQSRRIAW